MNKTSPIRTAVAMTIQRFFIFRIIPWRRSAHGKAKLGRHFGKRDRPNGINIDQDRYDSMKDV
jgi:hypothetical protein